MVVCAVPNCYSNSKKQTKLSNGIGFHRLPKDSNKICLWVAAINRPNWNPNTYSRVCSKHFKEECFYTSKDGARQLNETAFPTELLPDKTCVRETFEKSQLPPHNDPDLQFNTEDSVKTKQLKRKLIRATDLAEIRKKRLKVLAQSKRRLLKKILHLKYFLEDVLSKRS